VSSGAPFKIYLEDYLSSVKMYVFDETTEWKVDNGKSVTPGLGYWVKSIETAGRGVFSIRNYNEEFTSYDIGTIPLVKLYKSVDEIPGIVDEINKMDSNVRQKMIDETVAEIRRRDHWLETAKTLVSCEK